MHYYGLAIAVHVLTLSAGLPDYCASGGEVVCNWGTHFPQSRLKQVKKKGGGESFVWAYRGIRYILITAKATRQKSTAKSTQFPVQEFPNALIHNPPTHSFFSNIHKLSCHMFMGVLAVHVNGETHLLYWHIVLAYICHQRAFQQHSLWKYLTTTAL